MFLSILKLILFAAVVLLLGQIPVNDNTVAGHLQAGALRSIAWTGNELKQTKLFANLSQSPKMADWLRGARPPEKVAPPPPVVPKTKKSPAAIHSEKLTSERITQSDRESLQRLLE